ncbi:methyltransferase domain-containing protein [Solirubrobacter taibaiensis]|nr:methyltransferase domain-containing protein [Solirubrobacter taibaiensis]
MAAGGHVAGRRDSPRGPAVLDLGAGTGHHLAGVLDALPGALGIALDTSRPALRHAARAHPDIAAVVADVWQALPVADAAIDLVLDVFSPRNGAEMARVLKPGGVALVVIPTAEHLAELADLHQVNVDPEKVERLERTVGAHLERQSRELVRWTMDLTAEEVAAVLKMSPAGSHRRGGDPPRAATVTGSVELWRFRRSDTRASS